MVGGSASQSAPDVLASVEVFSPPYTNTVPWAAPSLSQPFPASGLTVEGAAIFFASDMPASSLPVQDFNVYTYCAGSSFLNVSSEECLPCQVIR